jgi:antitoxin MazE
MLSSVAQWGNSLAIRLPKSLAEIAGISVDTQLKIEAKKGKLILKKPAYSLDELVSGIDKKNCHAEIKTGKAIGNEIW